MPNLEPISVEEALTLFSVSGNDFYDLLARAGRRRFEVWGDWIKLCGIINAKSGKCSQNCAFCAQSASHPTRIETYPMVSSNAILDRAQSLAEKGVGEFSIVTSGKSIKSEEEMLKILNSLSELKKEGKVNRCASLGILSKAQMKRLKEAGLVKYHHNLETARSFFPQICTTHEYDEDVATIQAAKEVGLKVCAGGLFGLGESREQRIELAQTIKELGVDSVPINFLNPIPGTPLENMAPLSPMECLKTIAIYRLMLPEKDLYICGGREKNLGDLQSWIFMAGANGLMVGNYLTTSNRDVDLDLKMLKDQGLKPAR